MIKARRQASASPEKKATAAAPSPSLKNAKSMLKEALGGSLTRMVDLFARWDTDGNGLIDRTEFRKAVAALGLSVSDEVCDATFADFDADGSGEIEYREYVRCSLRDALNRSLTRVTDLFRRWDVDNSGTVDKHEFRKALREIGFDAPRSEVDAVFREMDADGSGEVEYKELNALLRQGARVELESSLKVGAAGRIETDSRNKYGLRGGRAKQASPPRQFSKSRAAELSTQRPVGSRLLGAPAPDFCRI